NTTNLDNEEESAKIAFQRLSEINVPQEILSKVNELILATKYHRKNQDQDINYFIDADLSILGQSTVKYFIYSENIRKEYQQFPKEIYNLGRKNVLEKFVAQDQIYKTDHFNYLYEQQARENLDFEINQL
ncbi:HD domain-containing protein, partial [Algoriella sp.]